MNNEDDDNFFEMPTNLMSDFNVLNAVPLKHDLPAYHAWVQRGQDLVCNTCVHHHCAINAVPVGKMLSKNTEGEYEFIDITPTPQPK